MPFTHPHFTEEKLEAQKSNDSLKVPMLNTGNVFSLAWQIGARPLRQVVWLQILAEPFMSSVTSEHVI